MITQQTRWKFVLTLSLLWHNKFNDFFARTRPSSPCWHHVYIMTPCVHIYTSMSACPSTWKTSISILPIPSPPEIHLPHLTSTSLHLEKGGRTACVILLTLCSLARCSWIVFIMLFLSRNFGKHCYLRCNYQSDLKAFLQHVVSA